MMILYKNYSSNFDSFLNSSVFACMRKCFIVKMQLPYTTANLFVEDWNCLS